MRSEKKRMSMTPAELLKESQLHGVNRLSDQRDRLFWTIALAFLLWAAVTSLLTAISRYQHNPTFLTREEFYNLEKDFPAVLICPELDFPDYKMIEFLDEVKLPPALNKTYLLSVLRQLAAYYSPDVYYTIHDLENIRTLLEYNALQVENVARRLTSSCEEMIIKCRWNGTIVDCKTIFVMHTMQFGFCCVFNGRSLKNELMTSPNIEPPKNQHYTYMYFGFRSGFMAAVNQSTQLRSIYLSYKWVIITESQEFVDALNLNGSALSPRREIWLGYQSESFKVSEAASTLSADLRRCRMSKEKLKYFPVYKQHYCRLECEMMLMKRSCNCTLHTHPAPTSSHCDARRLPCARVVSASTYASKCGCPPSCESQTEILDIKYYDISSKLKPFDEFYDGLDLDRVTVLRVHIDKMETFKRTRQSYFTSFDLFSQMGGIFNVFFGCSVLSLLEVLQFLYHTLKSWYITKAMNEKKPKKVKKKSWFY